MVFKGKSRFWPKNHVVLRSIRHLCSQILTATLLFFVFFGIFLILTTVEIAVILNVLLMSSINKSDKDSEMKKVKRASFVLVVLLVFLAVSGYSRPAASTLSAGSRYNQIGRSLSGYQ